MVSWKLHTISDIFINKIIIACFISIDCYGTSFKINKSLLLTLVQYIRNLNEYVLLRPQTFHQQALYRNIKWQSVYYRLGWTLFEPNSPTLGFVMRILFWKNPIRMSLPSFFCINTHSEKCLQSSVSLKHTSTVVSIKLY